MKNKLMPMWDKIMLRKRDIIECINELLKNKANLVHSRHRSIHNFIMNLCSALKAYCFFDNKPEALPVYVEKSKQLELLHTELIPNSSNIIHTKTPNLIEVPVVHFCLTTYSQGVKQRVQTSSSIVIKPK